MCIIFFFFFSSRRRHTRYWRDWSSDVCSSDLGKTNTPEFGAGSQTFNPVFGATRNPYDPTKTCGGSSGGAGGAVACGGQPVADGGGLGGAPRHPAGYCQGVGFPASPGGGGDLPEQKGR